MWHCCARNPHFKKCNKSSIYFFILKQTVRKKLRKIVSIFVFLKILPSGHFHHDPWIFFQSKIPISFSTPLDRVGNVRKAGWRLFWQKKKKKKNWVWWFWHLTKEFRSPSIVSLFHSKRLRDFITLTIAASISNSRCFITNTRSSSASCFCCFAEADGNGILRGNFLAGILCNLDKGNHQKPASQQSFLFCYLTQHKNITVINLFFLWIRITFFRQNLVFVVNKWLDCVTQNFF